MNKPASVFVKSTRFTHDFCIGERYIRNAEAAFRNNSVTEFLHRWFEDGRVADRSKKEKHQGNGRTTIEHPESLQEIACVKQFDLVQGYS